MGSSSSSVISVVLLVAGVALMLVVHIVVVFWALRRGLGGRHASRADEEEGRVVDDGRGKKGLSADELGVLPCHEVAKGGGGGGADCAVCLEAFEAGDRCRRLPWCAHSFHAACVDSWLRNSRWCPVCRADVMVRRPEVERKAAGAAETGSPAATMEIVADG
ncbi:hypothetical protein GUJ93_ZPchr0006g42909 [Zizania palustris]|uniref:RING-type domain-containing protein n=1 Tax=Zizania palustris TaxID=103762 RepID=A0A8J5VQ66_ZIZPA|nr:hypothetical protein GUJ93_ZPchr0006g42909 [Zizania palustris]